jgi:hypothetical protein
LLVEGYNEQESSVTLSTRSFLIWNNARIRNE